MNVQASLRRIALKGIMEKTSQNHTSNGLRELMVFMKNPKLRVNILSSIGLVVLVFLAGYNGLSAQENGSIDNESLDGPIGEISLVIEGVYRIARRQVV